MGKVVGESTTTSGSFIVDFLERRGTNVFVWPVKQDKDDNIEGNRIFYGPLRFTGDHELCLDAKDIKEMQQRQTKHSEENILLVLLSDMSGIR